jgi:hypothetical protein
VFVALSVNVKLVLLSIDAIVPIAVPPCVPIASPTASSVKNKVPEPITVVDELLEVTVPVRGILLAAHVAEALQLPVAALVTVPASALKLMPSTKTKVKKKSAKPFINFVK